MDGKMKVQNSGESTTLTGIDTAAASRYTFSFVALSAVAATTSVLP
jgi:hypothetical protein